MHIGHRHISERRQRLQEAEPPTAFGCKIIAEHTVEHVPMQLDDLDGLGGHHCACGEPPFLEHLRLSDGITLAQHHHGPDARLTEEPQV